MLKLSLMIFFAVKTYRQNLKGIPESNKDREHRLVVIKWQKKY
ncbi:hypothetical protein ACFL27_17135 [candidate division CSSED10-310 bacterium]|uniref:Uncharacterized protein n=1 Tax=candidate division CSSED10-310 bacterium TaxID=2855610 RepID=A0ABV6Z0E4_UNCC1